MINKVVIFILLLTAYCLLLTTPVSAHILLTDNNIGAVVHIDPEDDPIVGQVASFFFEFKDKQNRFNPSLCDCNFTIEQSGKQIYSADLFASTTTPSFDNASAFFTFSEKGIYKISVSGKPKLGGDFQAFQLIEDLRVERIVATQSTTGSADSFFSDHWIHFVVFGVGLIIVFSIIFFNRKKPVK